VFQSERVRVVRGRNKEAIVDQEEALELSSLSKNSSLGELLYVLVHFMMFCSMMYECGASHDQKCIYFHVFGKFPKIIWWVVKAAK